MVVMVADPFVTVEGPRASLSTDRLSRRSTALSPGVPVTGTSTAPC